MTSGDTQGKYNFFLLSILEVVDAVIPKLQQKFTGAAFYKSSVDKWTTVELDLLLHKPLEIDRMFQIEMDAFWLQCELTEKLKITKLGGIFLC